MVQMDAMSIVLLTVAGIMLLVTLNSLLDDYLCKKFDEEHPELMGGYNGYNDRW